MTTLTPSNINEIIDGMRKHRIAQAHYDTHPNAALRDDLRNFHGGKGKHNTCFAYHLVVDNHKPRGTKLYYDGNQALTQGKTNITKQEAWTNFLAFLEPKKHYVGLFVDCYKKHSTVSLEHYSDIELAKLYIAQLANTMSGVCGEEKAFEKMSQHAAYFNNSCEWPEDKTDSEDDDIDFYYVFGPTGNKLGVSAKCGGAFSIKTILDYRVRAGKTKPRVYVDQFGNFIQINNKNIIVVRMMAFEDPTNEEYLSRIMTSMTVGKDITKNQEVAA